MPFSDVQVTVKQIDKDTWELVDTVEYIAATRHFVVPKGFRTDFASVPQLLIWFVPRYGVYTKSAILHDYMYKRADISKADADGIFRRSMRELGVPFLRRWLMWAAVRLFGSHLQGISFKGLWRVSLLTVLGFILLFVPVAVMTLSLLGFWLLEMFLFIVFWIAKKVHHRPQRQLNKPDILGPLNR
ncbi:MAG TPA: DUF1353 domain-containing protein [Candidatus Saccharimonadales bacterium]|nr:DUF1353 domain-containing protein [Candidatus Saccharimonadales bacterium]